MAPRPTPTQDENDRAALGEHILEHEDDGSGPDPNVVEAQEREKKMQQARKPSADYQTRQATPAAPHRGASHAKSE